MKVWCGARQVEAVADGKTFGRVSGQWSVAEQPCRNTQALLVTVKHMKSNFVR